MDHMPSNLVKKYLPLLPVVPNILFSSSGLVYEKERTGRTAKKKDTGAHFYFDGTLQVLRCNPSLFFQKSPCYLPG